MWSRLERGLVWFKGSGGGTSGKTDYPDYMKDFHSDGLDGGGIFHYDFDIATASNAAFAADPYAAAVAYDPDADIANYEAEIVEYSTLVDLLSAGTGLDTLISNVLSTTRITDSVTAFENRYDADLLAHVYPRFEGGMRDINAVVSSAFVIGRAVLEDGRDRDIAKYDADLRYKAFGDDALRLIALKVQAKKVLSDLLIESRRIKIVAKKEELDAQLTIDEKSALWDLSIFKYGGNFLSSIQGSAVSQGTELPGSDRMASAIGGALAGGGMGLMASGGTSIGGAIGAMLGMGVALAS